MNSARLVVQGLVKIDGLEPVDCDAVLGARGLEFTVHGTQYAIKEATSLLIGGRTAATVNGEPVHIVANSVVEVQTQGRHQINVTASFKKLNASDLHSRAKEN